MVFIIFVNNPRLHAILIPKFNTHVSRAKMNVIIHKYVFWPKVCTIQFLIKYEFIIYDKNEIFTQEDMHYWLAAQTEGNTIELLFNRRVSKVQRSS